MSLETVGGFDVLQCSSGQEAIAAAAGFDPDLILLDVMMPGMSGEETLHTLREIDGFENKPFVFMTARASEESVVSLLKHEVVDVLIKPFDPVTLPDRIREIWQNWMAG